LLLFNKAKSPLATAIIERFNRTIRDKIDKYMKTYKTYKFNDVLKQLVLNYNNTKHSTTK